MSLKVQDLFEALEKYLKFVFFIIQAHGESSISFAWSESFGGNDMCWKRTRDFQYESIHATSHFKCNWEYFWKWTPRQTWKFSPPPKRRATRPNSESLGKPLHVNTGASRYLLKYCSWTMLNETQIKYFFFSKWTTRHLEGLVGDGDSRMIDFITAEPSQLLIQFSLAMFLGHW